MTGPEQHAATLDELLAAGRVKSALLLKGDFTDDQREMARQVWEAGIRSRDGELAAAEQRASQLEHERDAMRRDRSVWAAENNRERAQARREADQLRAALHQIVDVRLDEHSARAVEEARYRMREIARAALAGVQAKELA